MALLKKHNKEDNTTGFGNNTEWVGGRLVNKDGSANVTRGGLKFLEGLSWYHTLLKIKRWHFISAIFLSFLVINIFFTILYFLVGVQHLNGIAPTSGFEEITKVYFFSIQTFTTVGYGHISPNNFATSAISALEAFTGLLFFALATGLLYGRFTRPKAYIKFSDHAIIAPFQNGTALMFRLAPYKNNQLTEAQVKVNLSLVQHKDGILRTNYFTLDIELSRINSLVLSWTIVHPITEESPLYGFTEKDFIDTKAEVLVFISAFDESFSNTVVARTSYNFNEIIFGAKFKPMYHRNHNNTKTLVEIDKLNDIERVNI